MNRGSLACVDTESTDGKHKNPYPWIQIHGWLNIQNPIRGYKSTEGWTYKTLSVDQNPRMVVHIIPYPWIQIPRIVVPINPYPWILYYPRTKGIFCPRISVDSTSFFHGYLIFLLLITQKIFDQNKKIFKKSSPDRALNKWWKIHCDLKHSGWEPEYPNMASPAVPF